MRFFGVVFALYICALLEYFLLHVKDLIFTREDEESINIVTITQTHDDFYLKPFNHSKFIAWEKCIQYPEK